MVVWLLSHGADVNGDRLMYYGAYYSTAAMLQLLIDAGGDVNRKSVGQPPLFWAVGYSEDKVRVLLAQPSLDLTIKHDGKTPERYALGWDRPALAEMVTQEVSGKELPALLGLRGAACGDGVCVAMLWLADRERDERRWYDHCFFRLIVHVLCSGLTTLVVAVPLWQSAEQRCREMEAADAASVARLVRGVCCCRVARNAPLLCLYRSYVCWCGAGVARRVRVSERCEVQRYGS